MKSERITVLGTPEFKAYLATEAHREGISVSELVRRRCERAPSEDELLLTTLAAELQRSVDEAKHALEAGLAAVHSALTESHFATHKDAA